MLETNLRIVKPGTKLYVVVRRLRVEGQSLEPDLLERVCSRLRRRHGLAATRLAGSDRDLLVATNRAVAEISIKDRNWEVTAKDLGEPSHSLYLWDQSNEVIVTTLIERALLTEIARRTDLWTLDSPRIWYEATHFQRRDGIAAYRRYEVAAISIEGVGVGVVADVGTAFFTEQGMDYFFDPAVPDEERLERRERFDVLSARQQGQKGTLLYDNHRNKVTCYFEDAPLGLTCGATGSITVNGRRYASLYHYYRTEYSDLQVDESDTVVRVSFRGLERPQPVAAKFLRLRVMNENLPEELAYVDKIRPQVRKGLLEAFWEQLQPSPLGQVAPGLYPGFWCPDENRVLYLTPPEVEFAGGNTISSPAERSVPSLRSYYRRRLDLLRQAHCYHLPPNAPRTIYCAFPELLGEGAAGQLADDLAQTLAGWTGRPFNTHLVSYRTLTEAYDKLRRNEASGLVLFILDDEPASYYDAAFNLPGWRVKRVTDRVLREHYDYFNRGMWDKKLQERSLQRGQGRWNSFVTLITLDMLQQLDAVPYRIGLATPYEAQLVIDVGHDRRFFAVSLLIARSKDKTPSFGLLSRVQHKVDNKREIINPVLLKDEIVALVKSAMHLGGDPLMSLLILRDGREQDVEVPGIEEALGVLRGGGFVDPNARVDFLGTHKGTQTPVRLWEVEGDDHARNPLEGTGLVLTKGLVVLACTGEATLTQGTADPLVLTGSGHCQSVADAASSVFASAQLNWSSPTVAQRLPLPLKRTDEELSTRAAQEVRRIR